MDYLLNFPAKNIRKLLTEYFRVSNIDEDFYAALITSKVGSIPVPIKVIRKDKKMSEVYKDGEAAAENAENQPAAPETPTGEAAPENADQPAAEPAKEGEGEQAA